MQFQSIERCRENFPILMMCRLLKASSSGYYESRSRVPGRRQQDNDRLLQKIIGIHDDSDGVFGSPRIYDELRFEGETCSINRVARLMQCHAIEGIPSKKDGVNGNQVSVLVILNITLKGILLRLKKTLNGSLILPIFEPAKVGFI